MVSGHPYRRTTVSPTLTIMMLDGEGDGDVLVSRALLVQMPGAPIGDGRPENQIVVCKQQQHMVLLNVGMIALECQCHSQVFMLMT